MGTRWEQQKSKTPTSLPQNEKNLATWGMELWVYIHKAIES
jgi:hypothetical protein